MNRFQEQQAEFLRTFGRVVYDHLLDTIYVACQAVNVLGVDLQPEFVKASDDLILEGG